MWIFHIGVLIVTMMAKCSTQTPHCYVSNVSKHSNRTVCAPNYFVFPDTWKDLDEDEVIMTRGHSENDLDYTLCCPLAPDKVRGGLRVDKFYYWMKIWVKL